MQALGLQVRSRKSKKFTTYRGTIGVIAPNHLERDFSATAPKLGASRGHVNTSRQRVK